MKKKIANIIYWTFIVGGSISLFELEKWAWKSGIKEGPTPQGIVCIVSILASLLIVVVCLVEPMLYSIYNFCKWIKKNK